MSILQEILDLRKYVIHHCNPYPIFYTPYLPTFYSFICLSNCSKINCLICNIILSNDDPTEINDLSYIIIIVVLHKTKIEWTKLCNYKNKSVQSARFFAYQANLVCKNVLILVILIENNVIIRLLILLKLKVIEEFIQTYFN